MEIEEPKEKHPLDFLVRIESKEGNLKIANHIIGSELIDLINMPCDFDSDGNCSNVRTMSKCNIGSNSFLSSGCCCSHCVQERGYLTQIPHLEISYYKEKWDNSTGFFRKGTGCALDRNRRSQTCISYICWNISGKLTEKETRLLSLARQLLYL